jgi:hypothetical protein
MATERSIRGRRPATPDAAPHREPSTAAPRPAGKGALVLSAADATDLRDQINDLGAAALDAVRPLARRRLGRVTAREIILAARRKALVILRQAGGEVSHA